MERSLEMTVSEPCQNQLHYRLTNEEWLSASKSLNKAELTILYYLRTLTPRGDRHLDLKVVDIAKCCHMAKGTASKALRKLDQQGFISASQYVTFQEHNNPERQVCDCLKSQVGGVPEVTTPAGRIDLLTETEIIEIKRVSDWKAGLGQLLVYSGFFPEHRKRLHLFGSTQDEKQILTISTSCLTFNVLVTFELVGEVAA
jgi:hypothetical protein